MSQSLRVGQRDTGLKIGTPIGTGMRDTKEKLIFLAHFVMLARDNEWDKGRDRTVPEAGRVAAGKGTMSIETGETYQACPTRRQRTRAEIERRRHAIHNVVAAQRNAIGGVAASKVEKDRKWLAAQSLAWGHR